MLFTTKGTFDGHFLQFAAASFYYSTGYGVSFYSPEGRLEPYLPYENLPEPYPGYLMRELAGCQSLYTMNIAHIHYLPNQDLIILYPISHLNKYLGTVLIGPMLSIGLQAISDTWQEDVPLMGSLNNTLDEDINSLLQQQVQRVSSAEPTDSDSNNNNNNNNASSEAHPWTGKSVARYRQLLPRIKQFQIHHLTNMVNLLLSSTYYDPTIIASLPIREDMSSKPSAEKVANRLVHHSIDQEEKILQQLLTSDDSFTKLAMKHISKLSNLVAPPLADDPLRSEKNRFIVSATIVSRAAIKLGMPSDQAFSYSDYFINDIEDCKDLKEVWNLQMSLFSFFRDEVKKSRSKTHLSTTTNQLLNYIEQHIETNLSLQEICRELELDYKYASNCFKKDTGLGFNKYLTNEKMAVAKRELATTELPIQLIAERLGYNSAYYFTRSFKNSYGLSPTEFRKRSLQA